MVRETLKTHFDIANDLIGVRLTTSYVPIGRTLLNRILHGASCPRYLEHISRVILCWIGVLTDDDVVDVCLAVVLFRGSSGS